MQAASGPSLSSGPRGAQRERRGKTSRAQRGDRKTKNQTPPAMARPMTMTDDIDFVCFGRLGRHAFDDERCNYAPCILTWCHHYYSDVKFLRYAR